MEFGDFLWPGRDQCRPCPAYGISKTASRTLGCEGSCPSREVQGFLAELAEARGAPAGQVRFENVPIRGIVVDDQDGHADNVAG